jgi:hypothetical protein
MIRRNEQRSIDLDQWDDSGLCQIRQLVGRVEAPTWLLGGRASVRPADATIAVEIEGFPHHTVTLELVRRRTGVTTAAI